MSWLIKHRTNRSITATPHVSGKRTDGVLLLAASIFVLTFIVAPVGQASTGTGEQSQPGNQPDNSQAAPAQLAAGMDEAPPSQAQAAATTDPGAAPSGQAQTAAPTNGTAPSEGTIGHSTQTAPGLTNSPIPQHIYSGPHPYLDHICLEESIHSHDTAPKDTTFYMVQNGVHYFVGDLAAYGFDDYLYPYQGHHPVPAQRGGGYCNIVGPHHHHWEPFDFQYYQVYNGWYYYTGPWGPYYQPHRSIYLGYYFPHYRPHAWHDHHSNYRPRHNNDHFWPGAGRDRDVVSRREVVDRRSNNRRNDSHRSSNNSYTPRPGSYSNDSRDDNDSDDQNNRSRQPSPRPVMSRGKVVRDRSAGGR